MRLISCAEDVGTECGEAVVEVGFEVVSAALFVDDIDAFGGVGVDFVGGDFYERAVFLVSRVEDCGQVAAEFVVEAVEIGQGGKVRAGEAR